MDAGVPEYVFSMFQEKFAIITPALIAGAFAKRVTFKGYVFFIALWMSSSKRPGSMKKAKKRSQKNLAGYPNPARLNGDLYHY